MASAHGAAAHHAPAYNQLAMNRLGLWLFMLSESMIFIVLLAVRFALVGTETPEELNQFLIVLVTFVGIGYAARKGRHIRMSAIYDSLPDVWRKAVMVGIALVTAAAMFVLDYYSYVYVEKVAATGRIAPSLRVPVYLTFVWVPIGFTITGIQYLLTAVVNLLRRDVYLSVSVVDTFDDSEVQV